MAACRDCGRQWESKKQCHCAGCHEHFSGETTFARHRDRGGCLDPASLVHGSGKREGEPVLRESEESMGVVWRFAERREVLR